MVTGLISNGRKLKDKAFVDVLEKSGLDFVQVTLESHKPQVHDKMTSDEGQLERNRCWNPKCSAIKNLCFNQHHAKQTQRSRLPNNHRLHQRAWRRRVWLQQPHLLRQSTSSKRRIRLIGRRFEHAFASNPRQSPH